MRNIFFLTALIIATNVTAQFGKLSGLTDKLKDNVPDISSLTSGKPPISTSFSDVKMEGSLKANELLINRYRTMMELQRTPNGGFVLQAGSFAYQSQSYCLKAGTQGPSKGVGYMFASTMGSADDAVIAIARNSVNHPEIHQHDIQVLLWAIIARAKFEDLQPSYKVTASRLLTPRQLAQLNRNALEFLPDATLAKMKKSVPAPVQTILDAENKLRQMLTNPASSFAEMEAVAVLAGMAPQSDDVEGGRWTLHPDGYYVRYLPTAYSSTRVEIHVPQGSIAIGKEFDPALHIAVPALTGRQRLLQSGRVQESGNTSAEPGKFPDPVVLSFQPDRGSEETLVKIVGDNFRAGSRIFFGEIEATYIQSMNKTEIYVKVPKNAITAKVKVVSTDAQATSPIDFIVPPAVFINAITTSFNDAMNEPTTWYEMQYYVPREALRSIMQLQRTPNGGFVLQPGYFNHGAQSYLIKAGNQVTAPGGDGYVYAPIKGPAQDPVMTILRNSVNQPQIAQSRIQDLISFIIAGKKTSEMTAELRVTASALLTPRTLSNLDNLVSGGVPTTHTNNISKEVKSGYWSFHPDGYYIRFKPVSATTTTVEIWVPQGSPCVGKEYDPATMVAVPVDTTKERILFSGRVASQQ